MKTITKQIELYSFEELDEKAKEKAIKEEVDDLSENGLYFLSEDMQDALNQLLEENKIEGNGKVYYSLSYSQGDGAMFEGNFIWEGLTVKIKQSGRCYNSNSKIIEIESPVNEDTTEAEKQFEDIYQSICDLLKETGYRTIEENTSEECAKENFIDQEATFTKDGKRYFEDLSN